MVAFPRDHALVLVLDFGFAGLELPQEHDDGLQQVERLEAGGDDGLAFVFGDPLVGSAADDRGDVSGADEAIEAHVGRIENRPDRGNDGDMVAEDREIANALLHGAHQGERGRRRGGFESDGKEHDFFVGILSGDLERVGGRVDDADVGCRGPCVPAGCRGAGHAHHVAEGGEDSCLARWRWTRPSSMRPMGSTHTGQPGP